MKNRITLIIALILLAGQLKIIHSAYTLGPMFHMNFGNNDIKFSCGIELAYWSLYQVDKKNTSDPIGFDIGIDFDKDKFRLYSEFQTGIIFFGLSIGPVIESTYHDIAYNYHLGVQASLWGACYGGVNLRIRSLESYYFAPGIFIKYPFYSKSDEMPSVT